MGTEDQFPLKLNSTERLRHCATCDVKVRRQKEEAKAKKGKDKENISPASASLSSTSLSANATTSARTKMIGSPVCVPTERATSIGEWSSFGYWCCSDMVLLINSTGDCTGSVLPLGSGVVINDLGTVTTSPPWDNKISSFKCF